MKNKAKINRLKVQRIAFAASLLLIVGSVILTVFIKADNVRQRSSDLVFAQNYISEKSSDELCSLLTEFVSSKITAFESVDEVNLRIKNLIEDGELSLFRDENYSSERPSYAVCFGGEELFTLVLNVRTFSFKSAYKAESLTVSEGITLCRDITVNVPAASILTVNGITVERAKADPDAYCDLTEFEASLSDSIKSDKYSLGTFFFTPDISVVYDGSRLNAGEVINGSTHYHFPFAKTESYSFTVPTGSVITLNGITVGKEYITSERVRYSFISKYEERAEKAPTSTVYQVSGLFSEPEIEVKYDGVTLEGENGIYALPDGLTNEIVVAVPDYALLKINGVTVSASEITKKKEELPILEGITGYAKDRPYLTEYTVKGLFLTPTVEVTDENGDPLGIDELNSTASRTVYKCTEAEVTDSVKKALENYSKAYAKYLYNGGNDIGVNFNSAIKYTPYSAPAYNHLKNAYSSLYGEPTYKDISYGEISVESYTPFSESAYSALITLPVYATLDGEDVELTLRMELLCTFSGSRRWINYKVISD